MQEETRYITGQIQYPDMELTDRIPQTAWISYKDLETGKEDKALLPLIDYRVSGEHWSPEFEMELQIEEFGADYFILGDEIVRWEKPEELLAFQEELLAQAGLQTEYYQIEEIDWANQNDRKGRLLAKGKKRVRDCTATYGGEILANSHKSQVKQSIGEKNQITEIVQSQPSFSGPFFCFLLIGFAAVCGFLILKKRRILFQTRQKRVLCHIGTGLCLAGLILCGAQIFFIGQSYQKAGAVYENVQRFAHAPKDSSTGGKKPSRQQKDTSENQVLPPVNEAYLKSINAEYKMWILIPRTRIDYPAVQHEDNLYYLEHAFDHTKQVSGGIFLDQDIIPLVSGNTIIYGHNMKDGSMFSDLKQYKEQEFFEKHPEIFLHYQGEWIKCPVFSVQIRDQADGKVFKNNLLEKEWEDYKRDMKEASIYETGVEAETGQKIVTLSTCYGTDRNMIVQAVVPVS